MQNHTLVWLRNDLRIADNPALSAAIATGGYVTVMYIHEQTNAVRTTSGAALWWLERSLSDLEKSLDKKNIELVIEAGDPMFVIEKFLIEEEITSVFWNRRYAPSEREYDSEIKHTLKNMGIKAKSFAGNLLIEPWEISTGSGSSYQVYTPFAKALRQQDIAYPLTIAEPPAPKPPRAYSRQPINAAQPHWAKKMQQHWQIGEAAAKQNLYDFFDTIIGTYADDRDRPEVLGTSKLSPYLRFGEISVRQVWYATLHFMEEHPEKGLGAEKFLSELIWRDFHYYQLYHRADITTYDMRPTLNAIEWRDDTARFNAWTKGQTGIPIIDAGMRQLWATGWMHNRVRMLVASFLTKNLMIDWRQGESWFWDTLIDADVASNPGSWQWVAGCGMDAAPYFRVFNPVVQGKRFDPEGSYVRQWVPEVARVPSKWVHDPFNAPAEILRLSGIKLGSDYPLPIADLSASQRLFKEIIKGSIDLE